MSWIKNVEDTVVKDVEWMGAELWTIFTAVIQAEKQTIAQQIMPLLKQAAINLQNESPGLSARDFIPAVVAAILPIIPEALADIEHTAIFTFASVIAGQLGVTNAPGNQGNLAQGTDTTPTS